MNSQTFAEQRYTCKAYDAQRQISPETLQRLLEVLRLSPSAINIQPWQFLVAQDLDAKQKIAQATQGEQAYNAAKIINSSAVIVLCAKMQIDDTHLQQIIDCEDQAGRFATPEIKQQRIDLCNYYMQQKRNASHHELQSWINNQVYIALGMLLMAAEIEGIQATPIEGYDKAILDDVLDLKNQNLQSCVMVSLGYASNDDFNRSLNKGRLSAQQVIQYL